jgi:hypothetical protein
MTKSIMKKMSVVYLAAVTVLCFFFFSCSPRLLITVEDQNSGSLVFNTETGTAVESLIRSVSGAANQTPLFEREKISRSLAEAGLTVTDISFPDNTGIAISAQVPDFTKKNPSMPNAFSISSQSGITTMTVTVSEQILKTAAALMPPETVAYLDLLMAPVFSGEQLSRSEYIDLFAMVYGDTVASEMKKAHMYITLKSPHPIKTATVSDSAAAQVSFTGNEATFAIPLDLILTKSDTTIFTVSW